MARMLALLMIAALMVATLLSALAAGAPPADAVSGPTVGASVEPVPDEQFLQDAFVGLLGRQPDAGGLEFWLGRLAQGESRQILLALIGDSGEQRELVVRRSYDWVLGRAPDSGGLAFWSAGLIDDRSVRLLQAELFGSAEYFNQAGGTATGFVDRLYEDALGRSPDGDGRSYWLDQLVAGTSRFTVARTLLALPEALLQPELAVVDSSPGADTVAPDLSSITIVLDRAIDPTSSTVLVSLGGVRLSGTVMAGPDADSNTLIFTPFAVPGPTDRAARQVIVTVFAHDGVEVSRTDFAFRFRPTAGTRDDLIVAFYGHAKTPDLGVMGEGTPAEAAARLLEQAAPYRASGRPVVPAFELIATLATAAAGERNLYSARTPHELIWPYLQTIREHDGLLVLDLQPGRADFEDEARFYEPLLLQPEVGLALDPEWKVGPTETPAGNIGAVEAEEINRVSAYLSELVATHDLPDKLLVIHRFRPDMVRSPEAIVSRPGVVILFQADGEGSPAAKIADYNTLLPERFARGFKVFYDEDSPTMTPDAVLTLLPTPDYVSYQ